MPGLAPEPTLRDPSCVIRSHLFRLWLAAAALLLGLTGIARPEALIDISWRKVLAPVHGAINRDEATTIQLVLSADGSVPQIEILWKLQVGEETKVSGDTLVSGTSPTREKVFTLHLPPLAPGDYVLDLTADPNNQIPEKDEGNNRIRFALRIPNGKPVLVRCESSDGKTWKIQRLEIETAGNVPYPTPRGTRPDTVRSTEYEIGVSGVEPGTYSGVLFAPSVNRQPVLISSGSFEMPDPPRELHVVWPRSTPYIVGRPTLGGEIQTGAGGEAGAPIWKANAQVHLDGGISNPADHSADVEWVLRFVPKDSGMQSVERDTLLTLGAYARETLTVTGRVPLDQGDYLLQAEIRIPWPSGFERLGDDERVASYIFPLGWVEVQR